MGARDGDPPQLCRCDSRPAQQQAAADGRGLLGRAAVGGCLLARWRWRWRREVGTARARDCGAPGSSAPRDSDQTPAAESRGRDAVRRAVHHTIRAAIGHPSKNRNLGFVQCVAHWTQLSQCRILLAHRGRLVGQIHREAPVSRGIDARRAQTSIWLVRTVSCAPSYSSGSASHARGRWFETTRAHSEKICKLTYYVGVLSAEQAPDLGRFRPMGPSMGLIPPLRSWLLHWRNKAIGCSHCLRKVLVNSVWRGTAVGDTEACAGRQQACL
jgi:hypothetical protein